MKYKRDILIKHRAPEDEGVSEDNAKRMLTGDDVSSAAFAVYSQTARTTVTTESATTTQNVASPGVFSATDYVEIVIANGSLEKRQVASLDVAAGTITLDTTPTSAPKTGSVIRQLFGVNPNQYVTMTEGGNTVKRVGEEDWWWQGTLLFSAYPELVPGIKLEVQTVIAATTGGFRSIASYCDTVEDDCA